MIQKIFATKKSIGTIFIFSTFITLTVGIWLYAAHCFEKNINQTYAWLLKTGRVTINGVHINKYALKAHFDKPVFKTTIDGIDVNYSMGDRLQLNYHVLTKTLTLQSIGDESIMVDPKNNTQPFMTFSKKDNKNDCKYSIRFAKFIPTFASESTDSATAISNVVKSIKSMRLHSKNTDIHTNGIGTFTAKLIKFTTLPQIQTDKTGAVSLHLHDRYTLNEFNFVADKDNKQPLNTVPLPKTSKGRSHMIIHLGDKSALMTARIINEFLTNFEWKKLLEPLEIQTKSEGKQTFEGLARTSHTDMLYSGSKKNINLHIDFDDKYDIDWKLEYLPLLQLASSLISSDKKENADIPDDKLLALLPAIESHNPVKKTIDLNITFNNTHINTKLGLGYNIAQHGAQLILELPLKKDAIWGMIKQLDTFTDQELETYIDGSITAKLILKNSKAILDDIESIFARCQKMFNDSKLFGDLKKNRQFADTILTSFGEKLDNNQFKIQVSYDTKLKKLNYDSARNIGDIMTTLLPMIFGNGHDHGHAH